MNGWTTQILTLYGHTGVVFEPIKFCFLDIKKNLRFINLYEINFVPIPFIWMLFEHCRIN